MEKIEPYIPGNNAYWTASSGQNLFLCPGVGYTPPPTADAAYTYQFTYNGWGWKLTNYMISALFGYGNFDNSTDIFFPKRTLGANRPPEKLFLLGEIKGSSPQIGYRNYTSMATYPHRMRTNCTFADGHIQTFSYPLSSHLTNGEFIFY